LLDKSSILSLTPFVLGCFLVAAIGSIATARSVQTWYRGIEKPTWNPPDWIFGPVWTLLYFLMAVAAWLVWRTADWDKIQLPMTLFALQLGFNLAWSILFFGLRFPGLAFLDIVLLWGSILLTITRFFPISTAAGWLLVPYALWVTFAATLNFTIWKLNRNL
jgi:tryptophan-rich sensory protein